jgi:hypothetical protein
MRTTYQQGERVKTSGLYNLSKSFNKNCVCVLGKFALAVSTILTRCFDSIEFAFHLVIEVTVQASSSPFVELAG